MKEPIPIPHHPQKTSTAPLPAAAAIRFSKTECDTPFTLAVGNLALRRELLAERHMEGDFFEIIFLRKARGHVTLNHRLTELHDGMTLFISPHDLQAWHVDWDHTEGHYLIFMEEFAGQFVADSCFVYRMLYFYQNSQAPYLCDQGEAMAEYEATLEAIQGELRQPVADSYNMVVAQFCLLLIALNRRYAATYGLPFAPSRANYAFLFKQLLETHVQQWQRVEDYAAELKISRISLNKFCVAQYGLTATEMIKQRLLKTVKNALIFTDQSLSQIALSCGFSEASHLARFFKQRTGMTTSEFVSAYQKGNI